MGDRGACVRGATVIVVAVALLGAGWLDLLIGLVMLPALAETWTARYPDTFVISIDDGFTLRRRTNAAQWGEVPRRSPA